MLPLVYCLGACLMLLLMNFVAKQACLVLWLREGEGEVSQLFRLFATPWTVAYQALLSMGFSRQ